MFKLGIHIDSVTGCIGKEEMSIIMGVSGPIKEAVKCTIQGITFDIAYSKDGTVVFYATDDPKFKINNFRYLNRNKRIVDSLKKGPIVYHYDQGFYIDLPQGWKLGFYLQDIITKNKKPTLKKNAKPDYIFKRDLSDPNKRRRPLIQPGGPIGPIAMIKN